MARGVWKPKKGAEAAVAHVEDIKAGGIRTLYIRELLQDGGAGDTPVRNRYMINTPQDLEDPGRVTPQGGLLDGEDASKEGHGRQVGLPTAGRGDGRNGFGGCGDVRPTPPE